ncbi:MAG: hypothetical protein ABII68_05805 [Pseudomonadota bacterium]
MIENSEGQKQTTKRFKYTLLKTFFNFFKNAIGQTFVNPCESTILSKTFRLAKGRQWTILEKDVVDEIIFKTDNPSNRLMLELMARGGMRIGEVLTPRRRLERSVNLSASGRLVHLRRKFIRLWRIPLTRQMNPAESGMKNPG